MYWTFLYMFTLMQSNLCFLEFCYSNLFNALFSTLCLCVNILDRINNFFSLLFRGIMMKTTTSRETLRDVLPHRICSTSTRRKDRYNFSQRENAFIPRPSIISITQSRIRFSRLHYLIYSEFYTTFILY